MLSFEVYVNIKSKIILILIQFHNNCDLIDWVTRISIMLRVYMVRHSLELRYIRNIRISPFLLIYQIISNKPSNDNQILSSVYDFITKLSKKVKEKTWLSMTEKYWMTDIQDWRHVCLKVITKLKALYSDRLNSFIINIKLVLH